MRFVDLLWNYYQLHKIYDNFVRDVDFSEFKNIHEAEKLFKLQQSVSDEIYDVLREMERVIFDIIDHKCVEVDSVPDNGNYFKIMMGSISIECLISGDDVYIKKYGKWHKYQMD